MGILLGKFRKKKSTLEVLENVEKEIKALEEFRRDTEQAQKRIVGRFVIISVGAYLLTAFIFYFYFFPANFYDQLFYIIPLIFAPVIIITVKRGLTWYYKRKISHKQNKLFTLKEEKKKLLDQVKETETYKVAKTILDKYAPEVQVTTRKSTALLLNEGSKTPMKVDTTPIPTDTVLRQRALPAPIPTRLSSAYTTPFRPIELQSQTITNQPMHTPMPLPRGILPRHRSVLDKMVDYLMGDGPSNRFALICKTCYSHNGMAHKDEYEYVSFRCCYCFTMNFARKKRPEGPKLEIEKSPPSQTPSEASESHSDSEAEIELREEKTEVEQEPKEDNETEEKKSDDVGTPTVSVESPLIDLKD